MVGMPDLPSSPGGVPGYWGTRGRRAADPVGCVAGLLLWQGAAWVALSALGLGFWVASLPSGLDVGSGAVTIGSAGGGAGNSVARGGMVVLWISAELLAIAVGATIGSAQVAMACRLRGGPRLVLALAVGLQGATLAAGLVVTAVTVMVAGTLLELIALNRVFLAGQPRGGRDGGGFPAVRPFRCRRASQ